MISLIIHFFLWQRSLKHDVVLLCNVLHIISMAFFFRFFPTWNNSNYQRLFPFCFIIADERIGLAFLIKSYFSLEVEGAFEGARTWPFSCCNLVKKGRLLMRQRTKCVTFYGAVTWVFFSSLFCYCRGNAARYDDWYRVCLSNVVFRYILH